MDPMTATERKVKVPEPSPEDPAAVLTYGEMAELSRLLCRNLKDKDHLIKAVQAATTINVEGAKIILEPRLLTRLKSRCLTGDFPGFLRETIIRQLHDWAGW